MRVLGAVEINGAETSFQTDSPKPALPGAKNTFVESIVHKPTKAPDEDALQVTMDRALERSLSIARRHAHSVRSSTTLAALAQSLEAADLTDEAVSVALEALELCGRSADGSLLDPTAARLALEVLIRLDHIDDAVASARALPIDTHASLMVAATLASSGRFADSHELLGRVEGNAKDAVMAFVLISEGDYASAVPLLRAALRRSPDDADSAHNLSIALWQLGSRRKAKAAALQATRSAPGREDISLRYLELLLLEGEFDRTIHEIESLVSRGVVPTARLLIVQARAMLGLGELAKAEKLLTRAGELAKIERDPGTLAEVLSNVVRLRFASDKVTRDEAIDRLVKIHAEFPNSDVVVANLAQVSSLKRHASTLRRAFESVREKALPGRKEFIEYQIATLEGHNDRAADCALRWLKLEPDSLHAASASMVALGIGMERWEEAAEVARAVLSHRPDAVRLNNAAYVLAMVGEAKCAIEMLEPRAEGDYVLTATLGLACLAAGEIDRGMKLYREAATAADSRSDGMRSLMTVYQALIVRQLGLFDSLDPKMMGAISLPPVDLPDDWSERPEFLRLQYIAVKNGYGWPLSI
ncbi:tetratricopeptide repeat protein [Schumannella luteola]